MHHGQIVNYKTLNDAVKNLFFLRFLNAPC